MESASNQIRTTTRPRCFLCGTEGKLLYHGLRDPSFNAPGNWDFKQCPEPTCCLTWLDPSPLAEDLPVAYQNYFTHGFSNGKSSLGSRMRNLLCECYQAAGVLPGVLIGLHRAKRRMTTMFIDDLRPGSLLDVGCGDGRFLSRMRKAGWVVDGVDFDLKAIKTAEVKYGLRLHHGELSTAAFAEKTFDAVTMSHVIEHVPDPVALLVEIRRVLKPQGRLVLTTPNTQSLGHQLFRAHWFGLDPPRHLHLFSANSLRELARRAGFELQNINSTAANADVFIGASSSISRAGGQRETHHPPPALFRTLRAVWWQYREFIGLRSHPEWGEESILICARP